MLPHLRTMNSDFNDLPKKKKDGLSEITKRELFRFVFKIITVSLTKDR